MFEGFDGWLRIKGDDGAEKPYSVSDFINHCNFVLEREFDDCLIEGEVASFKVNQGKWVFFDLKEGEASINCFMPLSQLKYPLTDGMKVRVRCIPKVTRWGKFSVTVRQILPIGEGSIKKSFELLKKKLTAEGLFDPAKKRPLPQNLTKIGVISSTGAAGYIDFLKILDNRWGGLEIQTVNTQVQGMQAAEQIVQALQYLNERSEVQVIAILRGGGSADDLASFNDEQLVRTIAASKIPVITGIGHEIDESLADLAADVRASTPSNAAERLTPDRHAIVHQLKTRVIDAKHSLLEHITAAKRENAQKVQDLKQYTIQQIEQKKRQISDLKRLLASLNPEDVLRRGYAIIAGKATTQTYYQVKDVVKITTLMQELTMEVTHAENRSSKNH